MQNDNPLSEEQLNQKIIGMAMALVLRAVILLDLWNKPRDADNFLAYVSSNARRLAFGFLDSDPEYDVGKSKYEKVSTWSIAQLEDAVTHLVWRALTIGRMVNILRERTGKPPINWYAKAVELDKESEDFTVYG